MILITIEHQLKMYYIKTKNTAIVSTGILKCQNDNFPDKHPNINTSLFMSVASRQFQYIGHILRGQAVQTSRKSLKSKWNVKDHWADPDKHA